MLISLVLESKGRSRFGEIRAIVLGEDKGDRTWGNKGDRTWGNKGDRTWGNKGDRTWGR
ncbi:hypothetical protein QT990_17390 [Microcoleus sp. T3_B1]|uniref:hypothetical protein n=1 Tax=Microcoleus sp. T3_B1 TaxID=3055425 RepID=UPI002FD49D9E